MMQHDISEKRNAHVHCCEELKTHEVVGNIDLSTFARTRTQGGEVQEEAIPISVTRIEN
jgi:hypothetical protein